MALALDGSGYTFVGTLPGGGQLSASLTTANGSGLIVAACFAGYAFPSAMSASGLTFTHLSSADCSNVGANSYFDTWTAPYTTNFSGSITATSTATGFAGLNVWGISGAATASFMDANGSNPAVSNTSTIPSISTSNANDFIFCTICQGGNDPTNSGGWTNLQTANNNTVAYKIVSATQSGLTYTLSFATQNASSIIAVKAAAVVSGGLKFNSNMDGLGASGGFFSNPLARSVLGWRPSIVTARRRLIVPRHAELRLAA